jgi:hypothetical protein
MILKHPILFYKPKHCKKTMRAAVRRQLPRSLKVEAKGYSGTTECHNREDCTFIFTAMKI